VGSKFSDGFLLGALVGGVGIYLLTTPKGNKILKIISEEGLDGLNKLVDEAQERKVVPKTVEHIKDVGQFVEDKVEEKLEEMQSSEPKPSSKKRFFRKAKN